MYNIAKLSVVSPKKSAYMTEIRDMQVFVIRTSQTFLTEFKEMLFKSGIVNLLMVNRLRKSVSPQC